jgi:hypothetical protein
VLTLGRLAASSSIALGLVAAVGCPAAWSSGTARLACSAYRPNGPYPLTGRPEVETVLRQPGVVASGGLPLRTDESSGRRYRNIDDVASYGLEGWTRWRRGRRAADLRQARHAGDWLLFHQAADGGWRYPIAFSLAGLGIARPLAPGWVAAQAQGDSISLLVRLYRATGQGAYLRAATRGLGPFERPSARHGFRVLFRSHVFYDGFPTTPPSLVLEDFQLSLLGLADLAPFDHVAGTLLDRGLSSLYWALPLLDDGAGRPLYSLTYLTSHDASPVYEAPAHTLNAELLCELSGMRPGPAATRYAARWRASDPHAYYR